MTCFPKGVPLLCIPRKREVVDFVSLDAEEMEAYVRYETEIKRQYEAISSEGITNIRKNSIKILSMIKALQMICSGGVPFNKRTEAPEALISNSTANAEAIQEALDEEKLIGECSICLDLMEEPVQTKCGHYFCSECITGFITSNTGGRDTRVPCPLCRTPITTQVKYLSRNPLTAHELCY